MNPLKRILTAGAMALALCIGLAVSWPLALGFLVAFEFAVARPRPGCAANALGTLATATIVQEALALVFTKRPVLNSISMGFTDRNGSPIAAFGQPVITRTLGIPAVNDFPSNPSDRADNDVSVTLNQFKEVNYSYTPQQYSGTNRDLVREAAEPMAVAMANHMVDAVASLWTPANYPARTGADAVANGVASTKTVLAGGWDYDHLLDVRKTMNKAGVPAAEERFYLGNSDVYASMLSDLRIVGYLNNQANGEAIRKGELPEVAGFGLDEYPSLPANGTNLVGVAGTIDACVYAHRVPKDPREVIPGLPYPGNLGIITEPKTGLSVMVLEYISQSDLSVNTKLVWMYGIAVGNPNNLQLVTSA